MTLALTNSGSNFFSGGTGDYTWDPMGADLIVAALEYQNATASPLPSITVGGNNMTLVSTLVEATSQAAVSFYTYQPTSPVSGATVIEVDDANWIGIAVLGIYGFSGASGIGATNIVEMGSSASPVSAGMINLSGVTSGSMVACFMSTMWGSTPTNLLPSFGWTNDQTNVQAAEIGMYSFHSSSTAGGSYSLTATTSPTSNVWLLGIIFEVKAGSTPPPPTPTTDIVITNSAFANLGVVTATNNGTTTFDPTGATCIVAALACQEGEGNTARASITVGGQLMQPLTAPVSAGADGEGMLSLYMLKLSAPLTGLQNIVVSCAPNWVGQTSIALYGLLNASGYFGQVQIGNLGNDGSWVQNGTINTSSLTAGSMIVYIGSSYLNGTPGVVHAAGSWVADGSNVDLPVQGIYGYHDSYMTGGVDSITLASTSKEVNTVNMDTGGSGFTSPPTVVFTPAGATGTATISGGAVTGVTITYGGAYAAGTAVSVSFTGGGGTGATATPNLINQYFWLQGLIVELLDDTYVPPTGSVVVDNSEIFDLGNVSLNPSGGAFDCMGGSLLVAFVNHGGNTGDIPTITYGGVPMAFVPAFSRNNTGPDITSYIAVLADPPTGSNQMVIEGPASFAGDTSVSLVSMSSTSGKVGANFSQIEYTNSAYTGVLSTTAQSLLLAFVATIYTDHDIVPSVGWNKLAYLDASVAITNGVFSAVGGNTDDLMVMSAANTGMTTMMLEFKPIETHTGAKIATGSKAMTDAQPAAVGDNIGDPTPSDQKFHLYWESFLDQPNKVNPGPDDFFLSRIPSYVNVVVLSFGFPQCTYSGITDNISATTGLSWNGSGALLQETIALLKERNPNIEIWIAVQQLTNTVNNDPYNPAGWGGMTSTHVANWLKFMTDFGVTGFCIDYECITGDANTHCTYNYATQTVSCYQDAELVSIVKLLRAGLPRPITLCLDGWSVGAYYNGPYVAAPPVGWNGGLNISITKDSVALAALDAIHVMTYDASEGYEPRTAIRAFQYAFPGKDLYIGLRSGPPDGGGIKRTVFQEMDYCNTVIMLGCKGAFLYSMMWDVTRIGHTTPGPNGDAPFGNYGQNFPGSSMISQMVARVFGLGTDTPPSGSGYSGQNKNLRVTNRPSNASIGLQRFLL